LAAWFENRDTQAWVEFIGRLTDAGTIRTRLALREGESMALVNHFAVVLYVTGVITASPVLIFLAPSAGLRALFKLEMADEAGRFFVRHWGLLCFAIGAALVYAGLHPEVREPVLLGAMVEKAALVMMIALNWNRPFARGMRLTAFFDGACSLIFAVWLLLH
jgi:hypothetical protein